ncbi:MAG TPA: agmatinase [Oceanospirillaceae bacterium]|nr:agmatinase [Oceanospirillaceae bacterium]
MKCLYWWGVPTLFRCPHDPDPDNCDIALVGVPHSTGNGTTERDQHLAPRSLRDVSANFRRAHGPFQLVPWDKCRINDLGDVPLTHALVNDICVEHIQAYYARLDKRGVRPVSIGGDHSITGPILKAIGGAGTNLSKGKKIAMVHFDAHTDTMDHLPHWLGAERSAAHWGAYVAAEGHVDPHKSTQIGIRGHTRTLDWKRTSDDLGYRMVDIDDYRAMGAQQVIDLVRERVGDAPVYITFDLDCLDPTVAPAVANLEPGCNGFTMDQAVELLRGLRGLNIIGADVVCLIPTKDNPNKITSLSAAAIMFEQISLIADCM